MTEETRTSKTVQILGVNHVISKTSNKLETSTLQKWANKWSNEWENNIMCMTQNP